MSVIFVFAHWYCHHYAYRKMQESRGRSVWLYQWMGRLSIHHLGDGNSRLDTAMNRVVRNSVLARCRREKINIWGSLSSL